MDGEPIDFWKIFGGVVGVVTIGDAILNHRKWFAEMLSNLGVTVAGVRNAIGFAMIGASAFLILQGGNPLLDSRELKARDASEGGQQEDAEIDPQKLLTELPSDARESASAVYKRHALMLLTAREGGRTHVGLPIDLFEESKLAGLHPIYRCRICGHEGRFESTKEGLSFRELSIQEENSRELIKNPWPKVLPDFNPGWGFSPDAK